MRTTLPAPAHLHWPFKWGRHYPRLLPAGWCCSRHGSCLHSASVRCVRWTTDFKGHLAIKVARSYSSWVLSMGSNENFSLQNSCSLRHLKEAITNFIRNIDIDNVNVIRKSPILNWFGVFANKIERLDACLQERGPTSNTCCNLL
jgi:hypothetical protein